MRIRCTECRKKISIDDAFAGGVCRCPYCRSTVFVPGEAMDNGRHARPDAPGGRPEAPAARPEAPAAATALAEPAGAFVPLESADEEAAPAPAHSEHIPMARPVVLQGIAAIVLWVLVLGMLAGAVALALHVRNLSDSPSDADAPVAGVPDDGAESANDNPAAVTADPFAARTTESGLGTFAGIEVRPPVVYLIDNSAGMARLLDAVGGIVGASVKSIGDKAQYTVLMGAEAPEGEEHPIALPGGYAPGGDGGRILALDFLSDAMWLGASKAPERIEEALKLSPTPRTLVLCSRVAVDDPVRLAGLANAAHCIIHTVVLTRDAAAVASLTQLAEATGGQVRVMDARDLEKWLD